MKNTVGLNVSNLPGEIYASLILVAFSDEEISVFKYMLPLAFLSAFAFFSVITTENSVTEF